METNTKTHSTDIFIPHKIKSDRYLRCDKGAEIWEHIGYEENERTLWDSNNTISDIETSN